MDYNKAQRIIKLAFFNTDDHIKDDLQYTKEDVNEALKLALDALHFKANLPYRSDFNDEAFN